jgi:phosphatidylserine decarboxylase
VRAVTGASHQRMSVTAPSPIEWVQPGGGPVVALEAAWGRVRRAFLRRFRPGFVARMAALRAGECPGCRHDVVDGRDLELVRNVCGFRFPPDADPFAWRGRLGVARRGLAEIVVIGGPCAVVAAVAWWLAPWLAVLPGVACMWIVAFFRDPHRAVPTEPGLVLAPADGRVDDVRAVTWCDWLCGPAVRVGIFLSLFDVHLNRAPVAGRVVRVEYRRGTRRATYRVGATDANEQMSTLIQCGEPSGIRIRVRQIAGPAARRIVNCARLGDLLARGERFGLIKFGSRTELWLPADPAVELLARPGQRVRAGVSVLARLANTAAPADDIPPTQENTT